MALTAKHVRIEQHGEALLGEYTQYVHDKETGMVGQKKTVFETCHSHWRASASCTSGNKRMYRLASSFLYIVLGAKRILRAQSKDGITI